MPAKPPGRRREPRTSGRGRALIWVTALAVPGLGVTAATCWPLASAGTGTPAAARFALARTMVPTPTAWAGTALAGTVLAGTVLAGTGVPAHAVAPPAWPAPGSSTAAAGWCQARSRPCGHQNEAAAI